MKRTIIAVITASAVMSMLSSGVYAQGETAVPFLLIAPDARASGLGETGTGRADDVSAIFWNVGGLAFSKGDEISLTHAPWLPQFSSDLSYDYLAYRHYLEDWDGTVAASVTYFNLGKFNKTLSNGPTVVGTWSAFEFAVTVAYATRLSQSTGLGVNLRYIRSQLAPFGTEQEQGKGIASDVSFDVGVLYRPQNLRLPILGEMGNRLGLGAALSNMGPKLYYIDQAQADPLPTNLRLGLSVHAIKSEYNNLYFLFDLSRTMVRVKHDSVMQINPNTQDTTWYGVNTVDPLPKALITTWGDGSGLKRIIMSMGLEYWYGNPRLIALRFGYFKENPNFGGRNFMTFGAGIRYDIYGFDFSYYSTFDQNSPLANQLRFSLSLNWGNRSEF